MFKVTVTAHSTEAGNKVTAKAKGKQVTLSYTDALTPRDFAEAAAQVLRKLDNVPDGKQITSADDIENGIVFTVA